MDEQQVKATFFCVGWLAEKHPDVIKQIANCGHELASHTHWHKELNKCSKEELITELTRSKQAIENTSGQSICGFRSPGYSAYHNRKEFLNILESLGFTYDSSELALSAKPQAITNSTICEVPPNGLFFVGKRLPINGGFVFRCLPYFVYKIYVKVMNAFGQPINFYIHSWELYNEYPQLPLGRCKSFIQYYNLKRTPKKFLKLLKDFEFITIGKSLNILERKKY